MYFNEYNFKCFTCGVCILWIVNKLLRYSCLYMNLGIHIKASLKVTMEISNKTLEDRGNFANFLLYFAILFNTYDFILSFILPWVRPIEFTKVFVTFVYVRRGKESDGLSKELVSQHCIYPWSYIYITQQENKSVPWLAKMSNDSALNRLRNKFCQPRCGLSLIMYILYSSVPYLNY